ncbi:MAG: putative toxin-antitoxin system toxin component, PIN family [candidate division NC10 bacterium]
MRIVLDTNVLLSALAFPGSKPDQVLHRVRRGEVNLFLSPFILTELERVLREKFRVSKRQTDDRITTIRRMATMVEPVERIALVVAKDDDNRILECALAARADSLVTGDTKHLLPLRSIGTTQILTPAAFLELR